MKYAKKKKKSPLIPILLAVVIILAVILAALLLNRPETDAPGSETTGPVAEQPQQGTEQPGEDQGTEPAQDPAETEAGATEAPGSSETTAPDDIVVVQTDPKIEGTEPAIEDVQVKTPFCTLYFPGQWADGLETKVTEEEWNTAVDFSAAIDGEKIRLFTLHFGGAAGDPVGIWEDAEGVMMDITMEIHELELEDRWTAEQTDHICAMQEALNYVLEKLAEEDGFTPLDE